MPSLIDIFNPSFFMFLGILVLVVALIVVYFESKMREQNHKISSMLNLVTFMADEINIIKTNVSAVNHNNTNSSMRMASHSHEAEIKGNIDLHSFKNDLISVSDGNNSDSEYDSGSETGSDSGSESGSESGSDSGSDSGSESENKIIEISELNDIKILKIDNFQNDIFQNNNHDIENDLDELEDIDDLDDLDEKSDNESVTSNNFTIELVEQLLPKDHETIEPKTEITENNHDLNLKSINISSLDDLKTSENVDYKKLALPKLRSVVVEKGLVDDSSKLKKGELLKLLGAE
jgi:hypothetical protein